MMSKMSYAYLEPKEGGSKDRIYFAYNPSQFGVNRSVSWTDTKKASKNVGEKDFGGGSGQSINLNGIVLDETLPLPPGSDAKGIKQTIKALYKLLEIDKDLKVPAPPKCVFGWGTYKSPLCHVRSVNVTYELFDRGGNPLRAKVDISLKEVEDPKANSSQNPTSRSYARKIHRVMEGETLDWIAYNEFGDASAWRHIAETNNLDDPLALRPGQVLRLVPLG
jgi:nucleoid-associated protein YgaU